MAGTRQNGNGNDPRHVTLTPDVSHIRNLDVTHEAEDVNVGGVVKFVIALTVMGLFVFVLVWGIFRFMEAQQKEPPPGPMAMKPEERLPPLPRLQAAKGFGVKLENGNWVDLENKEPEAEYRVLRNQWERDLNCLPGPESEVRAGCVSIDQAMTKVLQAGLPARKQDDTSRSAADFGVSPPTAASSGRVTTEGK